MAATMTRRGIFSEDKHAWTDDERHILHLLRTRTNLSDVQQNALFNHMFGLRLTAKVLRNQRMDGCRRIETRSARWIAITTTKISTPAQQARLRQIETAASQLDIPIVVQGTVRTMDNQAQVERVLRLEMVHFSDLQWEQDAVKRPFWNAEEKKEVEVESAIYRHGGPVHRVRVGSREEVDFMICDSKICANCKRSRSKPSTHVQPGQPRVHVSDLARDGDSMIFQPSLRNFDENEDFVHGFARTVHFDIGDQSFATIATVCDFPNCKVCSASKRRTSAIGVDRPQTRATARNSINHQ